MNKNKNKQSSLRLVVKSFPYVFKAAPGFFIYMQLVSIVYSIVSAAIVVANTYMIDTITQGIAKQASVYLVVQSIFIVFTVLLFQHILNGVNAYNNMKHYFLVSGNLHKVMNTKAKLIPLIAYESSTYLENVNKAKNGCETAMYLVNVFFSMLIFYIPQLIFYSVYFYSLSPKLVALVFLIFIPTLISQYFRTQKYIDLEAEVTPYRREMQHYSDVISSREYFKETRILGAVPFFMNLFKSSQCNLHKAKWKTDKQLGWISIGIKCITLIGYLGVLIILSLTLLENEITIGAFSAIFMSLNSMISIIKELVYNNLGTMSQNMGIVVNFIRFMETKEGIYDSTAELDYSKDIVLDDVTFYYPAQKESAIDHLSLTIKPGETLAIVGENGAGKTTLVRLIMGLYEPNEGTISVGGVSLNRINPTKRYTYISAIFQKFQNYQMTLRNNVHISQIESSEGIEPAIAKADIVLNKHTFPDGVDTMLSREFGGVDISSGQWQRIAIARGLYRNSELVVMDEPTAAIDPLEETIVYKKFSEISKNKTSIIVTHRLGSARIADRIIVMWDGKIIESGSHEELMKYNGHYAKMFNEQTKWFKRD